MEKEEIEFTLENYDKIVKKYQPFIKNCAFLIYKQYKSILDYDDAKQEVEICLWRCLKYYDPKKFKFMTYFYFSLRRLQQGLYYEYFNQVNILQRLEEPKGFAEDGESIPHNCNQHDERFIEDISKDTSTFDMMMRTRLTPQSVKVYDLYMQKMKVSPWLVSEELKVSRYHGREQYQQFRKEVANLFSITV